MPKVERSAFIRLVGFKNRQNGSRCEAREDDFRRRTNVYDGENHRDPQRSRLSHFGAFLGKLNDEADHKGEDGERLREGDADEHVRDDRAGYFRIAADRFERAADDEADADARAHDAQPDGQAHGD